MSRFEGFLIALVVAALLIVLVISSAVPVDKGTITCYSQDGKPYFQDTWRDKVENNGCVFSYTSDKTYKQTTVTGPCVIVKN